MVQNQKISIQHVYGSFKKPINQSIQVFAPFMKLFVIANRICKWKIENQAIRVSPASVISWISQKREFSRGAMEKTLGLNTGQAECHIKELLKKVS